jgi:hypothetical protein
MTDSARDLVAAMEKTWRECVRYSAAPDWIMIPGGVMLYAKHPGKTSDDGGATWRDLDDYEKACVERFRLKIESERLTRLVNQ